MLLPNRLLLVLLVLWLGQETARAQLWRRNRRIKYQVEKQDSCGFNGQLSNRRFVVGQQTYQVKFGVFCTEEFTVADTVPERKMIFLYPEQRVRVQLVGARTQEVVIGKEFFAGQFTGNPEWPKLTLGTTTISQLDAKHRRIVFSSFLGYPYSDRGWQLKYAVDLTGQVKFLGMTEPPPLP